MIDSDVPRAEFDVDGIMMGRAFGTRTPYDTAGINDNFFRGCTALEPTYIRANYAPIVTIGDNFFASCTILDGFGDSTNKPMFFSSDGTNGTLCNLKSIGANFLADCTAFTGNSQFGISYFPHVGEIGDFFMINCTTYGSAATDVVKIDEVNKIGDHFMRNIGAKSVQIADDKIGYVGDGFLSNCQSLTSFDFACNPYIFVSAPTPDVPGG
ncbi:MAG: leucine-rich repeat protein [Mycoplasmoidaceae bacterium]|nr:leucine-rich repeat protein [Mycoplasmoidaceae bacterium]